MSRVLFVDFCLFFFLFLYDDKLVEDKELAVLLDETEWIDDVLLLDSGSDDESESDGSGSGLGLDLDLFEPVG